MNKKLHTQYLGKTKMEGNESGKQLKTMIIIVLKNSELKQKRRYGNKEAGNKDIILIYALTSFLSYVWYVQHIEYKLSGLSVEFSVVPNIVILNINEDME